MSFSLKTSMNSTSPSDALGIDQSPACLNKGWRVWLPSCWSPVALASAEQGEENQHLYDSPAQCFVPL